jgi:hypothetical protein
MTYTLYAPNAPNALFDFRAFDALCPKCPSPFREGHKGHGNFRVRKT